jgi:DNA-binding IclR family transcriptional regulator
MIKKKKHRQSKGIQSVELGYRLLQCMEQAHEPLPLKDLARSAGMRPSTAHFYLTSYVRLGLVVQESSGGHYDLGPAAVRLGLAALSRFDFVRRAREAMFELRKKVDGAILLTVWGNLGPTIIYHLEGMHASPLEGRVGMVLPALSATGSCYLAYMPREERIRIITSELAKPGLARSPRYRSRAETEKVLSEVREHGVARSSGLYGVGYDAVAAPIFDHAGTVRVVLTVLADKASTDLRLSGPLVKSLVTITRDISAEVSVRPPPNQPAQRS